MNRISKHRKGESGQAVVLVTLGMIALCGMMGLAVDLGWAFFVRQAEQGAADAAALAAVRQSISNGCPYSSLAACTAASMVTTATTYATNNGFRSGTGGVTVTVASPASGAPAGLGLNSCGGTTAPPCVESYIRVTISERVPQLFAAVIGNPYATVAVTSIATVSREVVTGSLVALNRYADLAPSSALPVGTDLYMEGAFLGFAYGLQANMGIILSSTCGVSGSCSGAYAGNIGSGFLGSASVAAPFTQILGTSQNGWVNNTSQWSSAPINVASGSQFSDPFSGAGQPPIPSTLSTATSNGCPAAICSNGGALPTTAITGSGTASNPTILPSGTYWVANSGCVTTGKTPKCTATGGQMTLGSGYFEFVNSSSTVNIFGTFIFYGGLNIGASSHVTFGPGMYIFAGSNQSCSTGAPCPEITVNQGAQICDGPLHNPFCGAAWSPPAGNAGEIFVFTGSTSGSTLTYPNLPANPSYVTTCACLTYGQAGIYLSASGTSGTGINLHGMNTTNSNLPSNLQPYTPVLMWQDQGNSHVAYTSTGFVSTASCSGTIDLPCTNPGVSGSSLSPQLNLTLGLGWSGVVSNYSGTIYQPRGAWTNIQMNPDTVSFLTPDPVPIQIISGATIVQPAPISIVTGLILDNMINPPPATHIAGALVQ